jgi:hypothetical protein
VRIFSSSERNREVILLNGQDYMLLYHNKSGKGVMYKINASGTLSGKAATHAGWKKPGQALNIIRLMART